jgi:hypothetical protein
MRLTEIIPGAVSTDAEAFHITKKVEGGEGLKIGRHGDYLEKLWKSRQMQERLPKGEQYDIASFRFVRRWPSNDLVADHKCIVVHTDTHIYKRQDPTGEPSEAIQELTLEYQKKMNGDLFKDDVNFLSSSAEVSDASTSPSNFDERQILRDSKLYGLNCFILHIPDKTKQYNDEGKENFEADLSFYGTSLRPRPEHFDAVAYADLAKIQERFQSLMIEQANEATCCSTVGNSGSIPP